MGDFLWNHATSLIRLVDQLSLESNGIPSRCSLGYIKPLELLISLVSDILGTKLIPNVLIK